MALVDAESWGLSTTTTDYSGGGINAAAGTWSVGTGGAMGDPYASMLSSTGTQTRTLPSTYNSFIYGARHTLNYTSSVGGNPLQYLIFQDSAGTEQFRLIISYGYIQVARTTSNILATYITNQLLGNTGFFLEVSATISTTVGSVVVRINGIQVISLSNVNNQNAAGTTVGRVNWSVNNINLTLTLQHFYFCDTTGSAPWNTFLGDVRVYLLKNTSNDAVQFVTTADAAADTQNNTATGTYAMAVGALYYAKVTITRGGQLNSVKIQQSTASITGHVKTALYADNGAGTAPAGLIATIAEATNPTSGTRTFTPASTIILAPGTYWVAVMVDVAVTQVGATAVTNGLALVPIGLNTYAGGFPANALSQIYSISSTVFWAALNMGNASQFSTADRASPSTGTNYNAQTTLNNQDTFNTEGLASTLDTPLGAQVRSYMARNDALNAKSGANVLKSGGTTGVGATLSLSTTYTYSRSMWQTDPNTAAAWTAANFNAAKPGYRVIV